MGVCQRGLGLVCAARLLWLGRLLWPRWLSLWPVVGGCCWARWVACGCVALRSCLVDSAVEDGRCNSF